MSKSRSRLAAQLFLLALLVTAACAVTALVLVSRTFERQLRGELERMVAGTGLALEDAGRELAASMGEIEEHLKKREPRLLELLLRGDVASAEAAALIMPLAGLDALEMIDEQGGSVFRRRRRCSPCRQALPLSALFPNCGASGSAC